MTLATHDDALPAGLPKKELEAMDEGMGMRALRVKVGSASFIVWTGSGPEETGRELTIRVFTAADVQKK